MFLIHESGVQIEEDDPQVILVRLDQQNKLGLGRVKTLLMLMAEHFNLLQLNQFEFF